MSEVYLLIFSGDTLFLLYIFVQISSIPNHVSLQFLTISPSMMSMKISRAGFENRLKKDTSVCAACCLLMFSFRVLLNYSLVLSFLMEDVSKLLHCSLYASHLNSIPMTTHLY